MKVGSKMANIRGLGLQGSKFPLRLQKIDSVSCEKDGGKPPHDHPQPDEGGDGPVDLLGAGSFPEADRHLLEEGLERRHAGSLERVCS